MVSNTALKGAADALLRGAAEAGDVPGVVAMATDRNGTLYEGAFGRRSLDGDAAMTTDSVALLASMTKAITATAAMQLVERGKLDLESPVSRWLPELGEVRVLDGFEADGKPRLRPPKRPLTLRHLLTHTSGFGYEFLSQDVQKVQKALGLPSVLSSTPESLRQPLLFEPGERWEYGVGLDWAGRVVEAASGQKLGAYFAEHILGPLGMNDTAFVMTPAMRARKAKIHARLQDGALAPIELELPQPPAYEMGGAGLYGTVGDYLKFIRMVLNGGEGPKGRVLKAETLAQMSRNQIGELLVRPLKSADLTLTNDFVLPPEIPHQWSLAWMINTKPLPTGRPAGSLMWAGLTNCYYWIDPSNGVGGVLMTQILPFADVKAMPLFFGFEHVVYQSLRA